MKSILLLLLLTFIGLLDARNNIEDIRIQPRGTAHEATYSFGIDISRYQTIMWEKIDTNINFIICKASEGVTLTDPKFATFWTKINPRVKKGAYHFFRPQNSGVDQAKLFLSVVKFEKGQMLPVIDVENGRAYRQVKPALVANRLKEMIKYIEDELHVKPIIYTNASFWNKQFGPYFKDMNNDYHLWIADYRLREEPSIPKGWNDWTIWQHSCKGVVKGILNEVDLNVCKVDLNELCIK
jgi:lysozyme